MKKMIVAGALALALTACGRQEASAWCKFTFGVGLNISYESTGCCWNSGGFSCTPNPPPCGVPCYPGSAPYFNGYAPAPVHAYAPAAPAAPTLPASNVNPSRTQQVGYYFYGQGYAPSYWYGN